MSVATAPTAEQARDWWRTLAEHRQVDGRCRVRDCRRRRRCPPRADAFAALIAHDLYHLGPPPTADRPHPTAG